MKLVASTLRNAATAYCHYVELRMQFRAKLLSRPAKPAPVPPAADEPKSAESCC
ncbi:MAG: hypothetical protein WD772_02180 [Pseudohongiellaceae bacterium]